LLEIIIIIVVLLIDQISKYLTEANLALGESIPVWQGVFEFSNVHNTGAAWGMFAGGRWIFIAITVVACAGMIFLLIKLRSKLGVIARICLALLFAGAVGNLIDRVLLGYVRDMLYVSLINFPVFNIADSAVCIAAGLLIIDTLFVKTGSLFDALEPWLENSSKHRAETTETVIEQENSVLCNDTSKEMAETEVLQEEDQAE